MAKDISENGICVGIHDATHISLEDVQNPIVLIKKFNDLDIYVITPSSSPRKFSRSKIRRRLNSRSKLDETISREHDYRVKIAINLAMLIFADDLQTETMSCLSFVPDAEPRAQTIENDQMKIK